MKKFTKILSLLLVSVMIIGMLAACGSGGNANKTVKIGVLVADVSGEEALGFADYYKNYIAKNYNVEFSYTDQLADAAAEKAAIEKFAAQGFDAIISFSASDRATQIETCVANKLYYAVASGMLDDAQYEQYKGEQYFVGQIGPSMDTEYIDKEFHNPITNIRTFGSDVDTVIACASRYLDAADENGVAVSIKHFPGDGVDERDQHILTSVNSLSCQEWEESYGKVYRTLIAKGAKTVMAGHIAQPAWTKKLNPYATHSEMLLPASLNPALLTGLLRNTLGFNGVISTDATPMVGFGAAMPRSQSIPAAIAAGADIILFNKDLDEDYNYLLSGIEIGILSEERLDEAVTRILALKASLHLPEKQAEGTLVPPEAALGAVGSAQFRAWADIVADKAITLVQDKKKLLPISPSKYPRLYLNVIQKDTDPDNEFTEMWKSLFEKEGFRVTVRDRRVSITVQDFMTDSLSPEKQNLMHEMYRSVEEMKQDYDLYVYVANMQNASNNTTLRLNWNVAFGLGDDAPWMAAEIPVLMISTGYPYHLFDAPMIGTYINAYSSELRFCKAVVEKLMGRSEFTGIAPSDPYCGKEWLKW